MTCAEFRELSALYAAGGLSDRERQEAEAHLREPSHEGCFEALREAGGGLEALVRSLPHLRAEDRIWRGIEARLGGQSTRLVRFRERAAWLVAAAAVVLLFFELSGGRHRAQVAAQAAAAADGARAQCLAELNSVRGEADAQRAALAILGSQSATIVVFAPQWGAPETIKALLDLPQRKGMILSAGLPARAGKDYELWVIRGQAPPRPAGLLRPQPSGALLAPIDPSLLAIPPDALAISIEAQGGSTTGKPSADIIFIGNISKS